MDVSIQSEPVVQVIQRAAKLLSGSDKRSFMAFTCNELCQASPRLTEERFGWGREAVAKGIEESSPDFQPTERIETRGNKRSEDKNPQLKIDIRLIVEPHTHADPELRSDRIYANLSAEEVHEALLQKGYTEDELPSVRTLRDILNRMKYRLKRIQKGKPLKKTEHTDAIFDNVHASREKFDADPEALQISIDTKTKVKLGEYSLGGKNQDRSRRQSRSSVGS